MNESILKIVENLLGTSIGFVGLIFASLSILLALNDDNWKIKRLKKSQAYKKFVSLTADLAIWFIVIFIFSIFILIINKSDLISEGIMSCILYGYVGLLIILSVLIIYITYKFKQLFILLTDNTKPTVSE